MCAENELAAQSYNRRRQMLITASLGINLVIEADDEKRK
jgi:hypothetical protein